MKTKSPAPPRTFQQLIFALQSYWSACGCVILQPLDLEVGAGTFHWATFLRARLDGHVWVADFIFTNCEGPCPRMSGYMRALQKATTDLPDLKMVSFTVDPKRDSPPVLSKYGENYSADPGRWFFLTGDPKILDSLDRDSFKLGTLGAQMDHSTRFVLVDAQGQIRGYYGIATGDPVAQLAADARRLMTEKLPTANKS